jgi:hypothetical protein
MGILSIYERVVDPATGVTNLDLRYNLPLIGWLTDAKSSSPQSRMNPLPFLKYNIVRRTERIYMQFIEIASLSLPAVGFCDPDLDRGENEILCSRFWIVPIGLAKKFRRGLTNVDAVYMFPSFLIESVGEVVNKAPVGSIPKVNAEKQKKEYKFDLVEDDVLSDIGD